MHSENRYINSDTFPLYTCIYTLYSMAHGYYIYMYEYIYKLHV